MWYIEECNSKGSISKAVKYLKGSLKLRLVVVEVLNKTIIKSFDGFAETQQAFITLSIVFLYPYIYANDIAGSNRLNKINLKNSFFNKIFSRITK